MNLEKLNEEIAKLYEDEENTIVFDIDFTKPNAESALERYKKEGIQAFKDFLNNNQEGYLAYTIRKVNSKYTNDYPYIADILYNFGSYDNKYKIQFTADHGRTKEPVMKKVATKATIIDKYIEPIFDRIVSWAKKNIEA